MFETIAKQRNQAHNKNLAFIPYQLIPPDKITQILESRFVLRSIKHYSAQLGYAPEAVEIKQMCMCQIESFSCLRS